MEYSIATPTKHLDTIELVEAWNNPRHLELMTRFDELEKRDIRSSSDYDVFNSARSRLLAYRQDHDLGGVSVPWKMEAYATYKREELEEFYK